MRIAHKATTVYDTRTRSTLEARWAIFFRELGLKWKYEPTTLRCDGCSYTPDFEVYGLGYIEIKPTLDLFIAETSERLAKIAAANPELSVYVFLGGGVSLAHVALYRGQMIYAPTSRQMSIQLLGAREGGNQLSLADAQEAYISRAVGIANTTRLNEEWKSASEIIADVITQLKP